jgi:hypothetical protein
LVKITADEARYLREHKRANSVKMTSKTHKSRGKSYYAVADPKVMRMLEDYRKGKVSKVCVKE